MLSSTYLLIDRVNVMFSYTVEESLREDHIPATQVIKSFISPPSRYTICLWSIHRTHIDVYSQAYAVEEVMLDLLHNAAILLKNGGRLLYLIPTPWDFR